jgi:hypothetical protein
VLRIREHAPTPFPSVVFIFGLTVESIKELGVASHNIRGMMKVLDLKIDLILSNNNYVLKKSKKNKFNYTKFS